MYIGLFGVADGVTGAVFRDTVRFTGELDAGTLTVKIFFNGNKYITTKYKYKYLGSKYKYFTCKYKYKYKYIKNVLKYKYQVPHLCCAAVIQCSSGTDATFHRSFCDTKAQH